MKTTKKILTLFIVVSMFTTIYSCSTSETENVTEAATEIKAENLQVADYSVEGMVCAVGCAKTIQDELSHLNGVAAVNVDFESGKAHVEYDKTQLSEADIKSLIEGLAEGQYKVKVWTEQEQQIEVEEGGETEEDLTEVSLPSINIPNLFSFLFNQL